MDPWMAWIFALSAMGMASAALQQVTSLKQEVQALADELHRRNQDKPPAAMR